MAWKRLTFILIPHSQDNIKQFKISRAVIIGAFMFLVAAIGIMIFYIIGFKGKDFYRAQTAVIEQENAILEKHLALFDSTLLEMKAQVANLESINAQIIEESEISEVDLNLAGVDLNAVAGGLILSPDQVLSIINRMDMESEAFEYNFESVYSACIQNPDFLQCVPSIRPAEGVLSREFGVANDIYTRTLKNYPGVDIHNIEGTPVVATADGVVEVISFSDELGNYIIINHGNGYSTRYTHLQNRRDMAKQIPLKVGQQVRRGDQIGAIGSTGINIVGIAAHLMYSVYHHGIPVDPADFFFAQDFAMADPVETAGQQTPELPLE